ncbi:DNA-methyltransferase [Macrococcoides caseolyticum]|uniref:DNA-methyltransferase n=1 Tax=Macrococcoides caseolyticum TaxID=69966 RepID=UPI0012FF0192|nr:site-specific DNA-methyltransferase [Macrococcus caseolyticus]
MKFQTQLLNTLKNEYEYIIDQALLDSIVLDVSRVADKEINRLINLYKKNESIKITTPEKNLIRKAFLGYDVDYRKYNELEYYISIFQREEYLQESYIVISEGINRNSKGVIGTIISRTKINEDIEAKYLEYIKEIEKEYYQLIYMKITNNRSLDSILTELKDKYDELENYHYLFIEFDEYIEWSTIYKTSLFSEGFLKEYNLKAYKKNKQIEKVLKFMEINKQVSKTSIEKIKSNLENFFDGINYGFHFQDLIVTKNGKRKLLVLQKVQLDETPVPCPSCFEKNVRGNSYPKLLYKSFECQNSKCPSRSKIGRGKRFDYYGTKRNMKLLMNNENDLINSETRSSFRRDIVSDSVDFLKFAISFYSWSNSNILIISDEEENYENKIFSRTITNIQFNKHYEKDLFENLPLYNLLSTFTKSISNDTSLKKDDKYEMKYKNVDKSTIINQNSTIALHRYTDYFNYAITSPPYLNAREYSQWDNMICYIFDMILNAQAVYNSLKNGGIYAYNIGDIVDRDNIYISSQMSKKRQQLGFYSMLMFELIGFTISGNFIWDKGEVQSKRNSSSNSYPGFLKPINCYEHVIIASKNNNTKFSNKVFSISPVRKINSKGENILGHTAPYPEQLIEDILQQFDTNPHIRILDPFLGSGTTCIVTNKLNLESVGFELNKEYYELAIKRVDDLSNDIFKI